MAVRATMADIIAKVRMLIGDPAGATQQFDDAAIQAALDRVRTDVRYEALTPLVSLTPSAYQYLDYYSQYGYWEADVVLLGPGYATLTPQTSELLLDTAHWTFPVSGGVGQYPPVFAAGKSFDVYRCAADLLEMWAALVARAFAFTADGATFQRNQQTPALLQMANVYRRQARPSTARMVRGDVNVSGERDESRLERLGPVSDGVPFITGE